MIAPAAVGCKRWLDGALGTHEQEKWTIQVLPTRRNIPRPEPIIANSIPHSG
jgi:hypothetical protein